MYRNYEITNLYIPFSLLNDKRFTLEEVFLIAIEHQYPKAVREDIARVMNVSVRQISNYRRSINNKLKKEGNFSIIEEHFTKTEIPFNKKEEIFIKSEDKLKEEENFAKTEVVPSKKEISVNSIEHKTNVQRVIKFLKKITSQEMYDEKREKILEIWQHTEMFTKEELDKFNEILSENVDNFETLPEE